MPYLIWFEPGEGQGHCPGPAGERGEATQQALTGQGSGLENCRLSFAKLSFRE